MGNRRYLIVARVGDKSLHRHWISGEHRNFDLFLSYYGQTEGKYQEDAEIYNEIRGPKWPIIHQCIEKNLTEIEKYEVIWFPDDDILAETDTINQMFDLFSGLRLKLGQPALTRDSYIAHKVVMKEPNSIARYTNFVEIMVPLFSIDTLKQLMKTFPESESGWGLDFLWPRLLKNADIAVLDITPVIHTRPIAGGGDLYRNNPNLNMHKDMAKLEELYSDIGLQFGGHRILRSIPILNIPTEFLHRVSGWLSRKKNAFHYKRTSRYVPPSGEA